MTPLRLTDDTLRQRGMPHPGDDADKELRGHVLVIAGSREMPGAAWLTATAALRAGAGKLTVATSASVATAVGMSLPEARVLALPETPDGGLSIDGVARLAALTGRIGAWVMGPGLLDEKATVAFATALLPRLDCPAVLDAYAMGAVTTSTGARRPFDVVVTPHAGEMAHLSNAPKDVVAGDCARIAGDAARRWQAGVVLKGATTHLVWPDATPWLHDGGNVGLATSGSGDTLAGLLAGLLARGLPSLDAALWAVRLHALAGERLAARHGELGYLARELGAEVPAAMHALCNGGDPTA